MGKADFREARLALANGDRETALRIYDFYKEQNVEEADIALLFLELLELGDQKEDGRDVAKPLEKVASKLNDLLEDPSGLEPDFIRAFAPQVLDCLVPNVKACSLIQVPSTFSNGCCL